MEKGSPSPHPILPKTFAGEPVEDGRACGDVRGGFHTRKSASGQDRDMWLLKTESARGKGAPERDTRMAGADGRSFFTGSLAGPAVKIF